MNKKIFISCLCIASFIVTAFAQETDTKKIKTDKKITKKVVVVDGKKNEEIIIDDNDDNKNKKEKKVKVFVKGDKKGVDKKVKIIVNGEEIKTDGDGDEKRITVTVDGDKVTINGKPVEDMNDEDMEMLKGNADHLKMIAPYLKRNFNGRRLSMNAPAAALAELEGMDVVIDKEMTGLPVNKALLGVVTEKDEKGAKINNVSKESAAEKAGLQKDDIITKVNDDEIKTSDDLVKAIGKYNADDKVTVTYIRDGKTKTTEAALLKNNAKMSKAFAWSNDDAEPFEIAPFAGGQNFNFREFHRNMKPKIGFKIQDVEEGNGVKILEVEPETPAAKAGLQKDDVIVDINDAALKNVDELKEKLANAKEGDVIKVKYMRGGVLQTTDVKFPKKLKTADL